MCKYVYHIATLCFPQLVILIFNDHQHSFWHKYVVRTNIFTEGGITNILAESRWFLFHCTFLLCWRCCCLVLFCDAVAHGLVDPWMSRGYLSLVHLPSLSKKFWVLILLCCKAFIYDGLQGHYRSMPCGIMLYEIPWHNFHLLLTYIYLNIITY